MDILQTTAVNIPYTDLFFLFCFTAEKIVLLFNTHDVHRTNIIATETLLRPTWKHHVEVSPTFLSRTFLQNDYYKMNVFSHTANQNINFIVFVVENLNSKKPYIPCASIRCAWKMVQCKNAFTIYILLSALYDAIHTHQK